MRFLTWWPLRVVLPLFLFTAALLLLVLTMELEVRMDHRHLRNDAVSDMIQDMNLLQGVLNNLLRKGDIEGVQSIMADLSAKPDVQIVVLVDRTNTVLYGNDARFIGRQVVSASPDVDLNAFSQCRALLRGVVVPVGDSVCGYCPINVSAQVGHSIPEALGVLYICQDLARSKAILRYENRRRLVLFAGCFALVFALLGLFLRASVSRRTEHLVAFAREFAAGKVSARANVGGHDELASVGAAFNSMVEQITISQKALHETRQQLQAILDNTPSLVYVKDLEGRFLLVNRRFEAVFGKSRRDLEGKTSHDLMPKAIADAHRAADVDVMTKREAVTVEEMNEEPDGRHTYLSEKFPLFDSAGTLYGICGISTDITGRKRAEEVEKDLRGKLERAARMESLGVLAGGVAHDLNNVLGPLVGLPDMVAEYIDRYGNPADPEHEDTRKSIETIKASAQRAVSVVSDLVVMGRRGQFLQAPVNVNRVVEQVLESKQIRLIQSRRPDVQVSMKLCLDAAWCMGSDSRLARVLVNLVGNAVEAIDGQGNVVVSVRRQVLMVTHHGYEDIPEGDYAVVEVMDTGGGMEAATLARIFEPFFSTKAPSERSGSGLGLSVVHGLVKDHQGFLDVKSEPGKGSTFAIYLPAVAAVNVPAGAGVSAMPGGHERILVVDDEPDQQFLTQRQLKKLGYVTTLASSGEEAVALFEAAVKGGGLSPVDVVLMDMIMPGGMDGLAACKAIRVLFPEQKILVLSGHAPEKYEAQVKALGVGWLPKPWLAPDLARAVRAVWGEAQRGNGFEL